MFSNKIFKIRNHFMHVLAFLLIIAVHSQCYARYPTSEALKKAIQKYQSMLATNQDRAKIIAMLTAISTAYEAGNSAQEHFSDFSGGFTQGSQALSTFIGQRYDEQTVYSGFKLRIISKTVTLKGSVQISEELPSRNHY